MYKILYLPTAEEVFVPHWICSDRDESSLQNVITHCSAYKYPSYSTEKMEIAFILQPRKDLSNHLVPKHLLEVVDVL